MTGGDDDKSLLERIRGSRTALVEQHLSDFGFLFLLLNTPRRIALGLLLDHEILRGVAGSFFFKFFCRVRVIDDSKINSTGEMPPVSVSIFLGPHN